MENQNYVIPSGASVSQSETDAKSRDLLFAASVDHAGLTRMPPPNDSSQPRLAPGCRWGGTAEKRVILFPEGAINLQATGLQVLERCDGQRSFGEIIAELQSQYNTAPPEKIREDISSFLEQLQKKRIVDY